MFSDEKFYHLFRRIFSDKKFRNSYLSNTDETIKREGITDARQIESFKKLVSLTTQCLKLSPDLITTQEEEMEAYYAVLKNLREGINKTIEQTIEGYGRTMMMYTVTFYTGILLILTSIIFAFVNLVSQNGSLSTNGSLLTIVFAGLGTADIISCFILNPPATLQESRADLVQLQASFYVWYQDLRFWTGYSLAEYWFRYRSGLKNDNPELASKASNDYREVQKEVSNIMISNTKKILAMIQHFVEPHQVPPNAPATKKPF
jgi:hypothetical protein